MKFQINYLTIYLIIITCPIVLSNTNTLIETIEILMKNCLLENIGKYLPFKNCIKNKSILLLENLINKNVIEISNGVRLLKENNSSYEFLNKRNAFRYHLNEKETDWLSEIDEKIERILKSHILNVKFAMTIESSNGLGRGKHGNQMSSLLMFAFIAMGMILGPMGFKFLVVLGSKALLLGMLAMILTSIQGLKKIATSNINYGLYDTHAHNPCKYDRRWYYKLSNTSGMDENEDFQHNYELDGYRYQTLDPRDTTIKRYETSSYMK